MTRPSRPERSVSPAPAQRALAGAVLSVLLAACGDHGAGRPATASANATPAHSRTLWLEPARVDAWYVWFPDELTPISDAVAEVLSRAEYGGYRVIPNQDLRAFWSSVQNGQLPGVSLTCDTPPPPAELAEIVHAGSLRASIDVDCEEQGCRLEVIVIEPGAPGTGGQRDEELAWLVTDLPPDDTPVQWAERIRRRGLRPEPPPDDGRGGLVGGIMWPGAAPGIYAEISWVTQSGTWAYELQSSFFQPVAAALDACEQAGGVQRDSWGRFVLAVNAEGRITRCEHADPDHLPRPGFACQCDVLHSMDFGKGAADRRASFDLSVTVRLARTQPKSPFYHSIHLTDLSADDPSAVLGNENVSGRELVACIEPISANLGEVDVPVRFRAGPDGRVVEARADWPPSIPASAAVCIDKVLEKTGFSCPLSGQATITGLISITVGPRE